MADVMPSNPATPQSDIPDNSSVPTAAADTMRVTPTGAAPTATAQTPAMNVGGQAVPASQPTTVVGPEQIAAQHESMLGKAVKALMGGQAEYSIDPQTGKMTQTPVQSKPGDIFRHILGGAILGAAVGADQRTAAKGLAKGAGAEQQNLERQDLEKRQQAQEQFRNQLTANKEQREQEQFKTEQDMRKAQTAMYNMQTLKENQQLQGETFKYHEDVAKAGQTKLDPYIEAGIPYRYRDVPEHEMNDIIKNNPGSTSLHWEPTGVKLVKGADGNYDHIETYSAVDNSQAIKLTPELIKRYKDIGMDKYDPNKFEVLKPGKELSPTQYIALNDEYKRLAGEKYVTDKRSGDLAEQKARIAKDNAEASRDWLEYRSKKEEFNKNTEFHNALEHLDKVGGDFAQLKPSERVIVAETTPKLVGDLNQAINSAMNSGNVDEANELVKQRDNITRLQTQAFTYTKPAAGGTTPAAAPTKKVSEAIDYMKEKGVEPGTEDAYRYISAATNLSPQEKLSMQIQSGAVVPWDIVERDARAQLRPTASIVQEYKAAGLKVASKNNHYSMGDAARDWVDIASGHRMVKDIQTTKEIENQQ